MSNSTNGGRRHEVHCSGVIAESLRQLQRKASRKTGSMAIARAFRRIVQRLERNPYAVGEPFYRLHVLRMQVRTCALRPLLVDFAICEDRPLVFIKGVKLLPER